MAAKRQSPLYLLIECVLWRRHFNLGCTVVWRSTKKGAKFRQPLPNPTARHRRKNHVGYIRGGQPFCLTVRSGLHRLSVRTSRIHRFYNCLESAKILMFNMVTFECCLWDILFKNPSKYFNGSETATCWSHLQGSKRYSRPLKMQPLGYPQRSGTNNRESRRLIPKKQRPQLHRHENLKARVWLYQLEWTRSRQGFWLWFGYNTSVGQ